MKRINKHIIFLYEGSCIPHEAVSLHHDPETGMAPTPTPWVDFKRIQGSILNISQSPITCKFWLALKLQNYVCLFALGQKINFKTITFSLGAGSGSCEVLVETKKGTWLPGYCILAGTTGQPWGKNRTHGAMQGGSAKAASKLEFQNRLQAPVFQNHFQGS